MKIINNNRKDSRIINKIKFKINNNNNNLNYSK